MSEFHWLGHATTSTAQVLLRGESDGVMTVECNGQTFTGDTIATATDDGVGTCTVTGLTAGQSYPYTVKLGGVEKGSGTLRAYPANVARWAAFSCIAQGYPWPWDQYLLDREIHFVAPLDDFPYIDWPVTGAATSYWGEPAVKGFSWFVAEGGKTDAQIMANWWAHARNGRVQPQMRRLIKSAAMYCGMGDHELPGNNWNGKAGTTGNDGCNHYQTIAANDAAALALRDLCTDAAMAYWKGHTSNADTDNDSGRDADQQLYFRWTVGPVEFFMLNSYYYCSDIGGASPKRLGDTQVDWLLARLAASTATFKCVFLTPGAPCFPGATAERDTVFDAIHAQSGWAVPGGCFVICGDIHLPHVWAQSTARGDARDLAIINTSPSGQGWNTSPSYSGGAVYLPGPVGSEVGAYRNVAYCEADSEKVTIRLVDDTLRTRWKGEIRAGSNALTYPAVSYG